MSDFKYAVRTFIRNPGFTAVVILTLGLGIGATTAIFSVVNAVLIEPLPYRDADRLFATQASLPDYQDLTASTQSFDATASWASNLYNLATGTETRQVLGGTVTRSLLPLLGAEPILGRNFTAEDETRPTVILSDSLWRTQFGGDARVLGRSVRLSGTTYTVIGVAPAWFRFPTAEFQLWTPLRLIEQQAPKQAANRAFRIFRVVAHLKPGVTPGQAQAELSTLSARLAREYPSTNEGMTLTLVPLRDRIVGEARPALKLLLGTVALLLLIACANIANLLLARTTVREREFAIRAALGAGRARILRQLIIESLTLAIAGGFLGLLITMWGVDALRSLLDARLPRAEGIRIDTTVLAFTMIATLVTGMMFGLAPALQAARGTSGSLKESGRGILGTMRGRRVRRTIAIAQTALAFVVLVGAGLLVRSFMALTAHDLGFAPAHLLSFNVQFVQLPDDVARAEAAARLIERLSHVPGVEAVGGATGLAAVTPQRGTRFAVEGRTLTSSQDTALFMAATPGYFRALQTAVLQGRPIEAADTPASEPVVVVNRTLAQQLFPKGDAVGRRMKILNPEQAAAWRTIVGVVADVDYAGLQEEPRPAIYTPFVQTPFLWLYVMLRTPARLDAILPVLRAVVPAVNPTLVAGDVRSMTDLLSLSVAEPRFNMLLVSAFAALALLLSAIGIYGVIAYSVAQRTHEIGVRIALGARSSDVRQLIVGEGAALGLAGVGLGVVAAALLARLMAGLLFGIGPRDPLTFAFGAALLLCIALGSSYVPARRASRVEAITALRQD